MALIIRLHSSLDPLTANTFSPCEVFGTKYNKVYFAGSRQACENHVRNVKAKTRRKLRDNAMRDIGMVKVRGAMGGTYWE